ncbi:hypothetical protein [Chryseobacterium oryctis]|uniref:DUF4177 domain-containing protein n=1 Tax=Chryseobacterium oryctis TaxID=2952618 RepID=A0ABT3HLV9_9FLAO|nr:hypothetical protein [Chryseobacterium oryctis]MCW3160777.1 hypothetical protein [Chryseobacterium oryctis]
MEYKVIPFVATATHQNMSSINIAQQLEKLIATQTNEGWKYIRLESVSTYIQPTYGCFGIGAKHGYMAYYQMAIFSKE